MPTPASCSRGFGASRTACCPCPRRAPQLECWGVSPETWAVDTSARSRLPDCVTSDQWRPAPRPRARPTTTAQQAREVEDAAGKRKRVKVRIRRAFPRSRDEAAGTHHGYLVVALTTTPAGTARRRWVSIARGRTTWRSPDSQDPGIVRDGFGLEPQTQPAPGEQESAWPRAAPESFTRFWKQRSREGQRCVRRLYERSGVARPARRSAGGRSDAIRVAADRCCPRARSAHGGAGEAEGRRPRSDPWALRRQHHGQDGRSRCPGTGTMVSRCQPDGSWRIVIHNPIHPEKTRQHPTHGRSPWQARSTEDPASCAGRRFAIVKDLRAPLHREMVEGHTYSTGRRHPRLPAAPNSGGGDHRERAGQSPSARP